MSTTIFWVLRLRALHLSYSGDANVTLFYNPIKFKAFGKLQVYTFERKINRQMHLIERFAMLQFKCNARATITTPGLGFTKT